MFHWIPVSPTRHPRCRVNDELGHENDGVAPATIFFIVSGIQKVNNESAIAAHVSLDSRVPQLVIPAVAGITSWGHENDGPGESAGVRYKTLSIARVSG